MMYKFLAPELSAQLMIAPTGRPKVIRYLLPEAPPRPGKDQHDQFLFVETKEGKRNSNSRDVAETWEEVRAVRGFGWMD
jgi:hypothetical protein